MPLPVGTLEGGGEALACQSSGKLYIGFFVGFWRQLGPAKYAGQNRSGRGIAANGQLKEMSIAWARIWMDEGCLVGLGSLGRGTLWCVLKAE